jgi:hypothetical protein
MALFVALGGGAGFAQRAQGPRGPQLQPDSGQGIPTANAHETRGELFELLQKHPPSVAQVLRLDPSLLTQAEYLDTYPELQAFLGLHPEIVRDPVFFLGRPPEDGVYDNRARALNVLSSLIGGTLGLMAFVAFLTAFTWVIRSSMDYRRWLRLSKIQVEVHGKLMDRLSSNEDLLAYMQSTAGRRFLEAAPIPVDTGARALSAPVARILWSAQAGVVIAFGGLGLQFVSRRVGVEEVSQGLFVMGAVGSALGLGFILSAVGAYLLSRRLGLVEPVPFSLPADAGAPPPRT